MNSKTAKKQRKLIKKAMEANWTEYFLTMKKQPWTVRWRFAWQILFTPVQKRSILQRIKSKLRRAR